MSELYDIIRIDHFRGFDSYYAIPAKDVVKEPFAVINGDDYYGKESFKVLADWFNRNAGSTGKYTLVGFELDKTLSESGITIGVKIPTSSTR